MTIMQIVYPGLGGTSSVAFSLVEGQSQKYNNFFIFTGIERIRKDFIKKCKVNKINYLYLKKKRFQFNIFKLFKITSKLNPKIILVHDYFLLPFFFYKLKKKNIKLCFIHHTPDKTKNFVQWLFFFLNYLLADKVILVSKRHKSSMIYKFNKLFKNKASIIENGINVEKFKK